MVIKKLKSCLHHKSIYCAGSDAIYANSGRLLFQPSLHAAPPSTAHMLPKKATTAHCSCGDLMVACWRYSADDISIMGLHCRQTHYKPAIRGNTGDWTTQTVRPKTLVLTIHTDLCSKHNDNEIIKCNIFHI